MHHPISSAFFPSIVRVTGDPRQPELWDAQHPHPNAAQGKTKWVAVNEFER